MICVFFFQLPYSQLACSGDNDVNPYSYDWILKPREDGSVDVDVKITLGESRSSYSFVLTKDYHIEDIKAWEVEAGKDIKCTETEENDNIRYDFEFECEKEKGFNFYVEFKVRENIVYGYFMNLFSIILFYKGEYENKNAAVTYRYSIYLKVANIGCFISERFHFCFS